MEGRGAVEKRREKRGREERNRGGGKEEGRREGRDARGEVGVSRHRREMKPKYKYTKNVT